MLRAVRRRYRRHFGRPIHDPSPSPGPDGMPQPARFIIQALVYVVWAEVMDMPSPKRHTPGEHVVFYLASFFILLILGRALDMTHRAWRQSLPFPDDDTEE